MFNTIKSQVIAIPRRDIDTDLIIPAEFLKVTVKTGLGKHLFARVRHEDKDFEAIDRIKKAEILVSRENFGCGSSREHAAWALNDFGIRVIIAPSFADIFKSNAMKNGILPVVLPENVVECVLGETQNFASLQKSYVVTVDLPRQMVTLPDGSSHAFEIDPYRKTCLMEGMDDLDYLLAHKNKIEAYNKNRNL